MNPQPVKAVRKSGPERSLTRQAAEAAGITPHQMRRAIALASIEKSEFERLIESATPPGISDLVQFATGKPAPRKARRLLVCPCCKAGLEIQTEAASSGAAQ